MNVHNHSISSLGRAYRDGRLDPVEVTEEMLDRISRIDSKLGSYAYVARDFALKSAKQAAEELAGGLDRGPLHGIPIAVKDIFFNQEMPTTAGMLSVPESWRVGEATVFKRALQSGAVILGTTVTTEGVFSDYNDAHRAPLNPWGPLWAGASSSGPAVATAAGLCFGAFGSDTGGSIRFPAAALGVTGLKPTWGRVSRFGAAPLGPSLDHIGTFARHASDALLLQAAVEGYDPNDPTSSRAPSSVASAAFSSVAGVSIGIDRAYVGELPDDLASALAKVETALRDSGARIIEIRLPDPRPAQQAWDVIVSVEAASQHRDLYRADPGKYGPVLAQLVDLGLSRSAFELEQAYHTRTSYRLAMNDVFEQVDMLLCPVLPWRLFSPEEWKRNLSGEGNATAINTGDLTKFTTPYNITGTPTITFPAGIDDQGAPIGMQLCGKSFQEGSLTTVVAELQSKHDWHMLRPSTLT